MAEFFDFRPMAPKVPHWSTVPNDLFSLGVVNALALAAVAAGIGASYYYDDVALPLDQEDGSATLYPVDVDVF